VLCWFVREARIAPADRTHCGGNPRVRGIRFADGAHLLKQYIDFIQLQKNILMRPIG
jgi:hypothetical protein